MHFLPGKRVVVVFLAVAAVMLLPLAASADIVPVTSANFIGSRTTPDVSGVVAADGWTQGDNGGFKISWVITQSGPTFHYAYTLTNLDGSSLAPDNSHLILEVSTFFTANDISNAKLDGVAVALVAPQLFTSTTDGNSNPNMPGGGITGVFGIKFDDGGATYSFDSLKGPVWGDFYTKDGKHDDIIATAWNTGFGTDPVLGGSYTNWVPTPDTFGNPVPLPPTVLLLGSGLLGLGLLGWRRRQQ